MHIEVTPPKGIQSRFLQRFFYFGIFCATFFIDSLKFQCASLYSAVICKCKINSPPLMFTVFLWINTESRILFNMSVPSLFFSCKELVLRPCNSPVPRSDRRRRTSQHMTVATFCRTCPSKTLIPHSHHMRGAREYISVWSFQYVLIDCCPLI